MKHSSEEALKQFYEACGRVGESAKPPLLQPSDLRWLIAGPVGVLLMLVVVHGLPRPTIDPAGVAWLHRRTLVAGEADVPRDPRRTQIRKVTRCA